MGFTSITAACTLASGLVLGVAAPTQAATPSCFGRVATVVGTPGDDALTFGPDDVIYAGGGNDEISARDEWQAVTAYICAGAGDDYIYGGRGNDYVHGGDGADFINGGYGGEDTLLGDGGADRLEDFDDYDYVDENDPGTDTLRGGADDDVLITACGTDKVYGGSGQDTILDFTRAASYLYGGAGGDTIDATLNEVGTNPFVPDVVSGGKGDDTATVNADDIVKPSTEDVSYR